MFVIAIVSQKGGSGKSTVAAHLTEADRQRHGPAAVIDADPQGTLSNWWNVRQATSPIFQPTTIPDLPATLNRLRAAGVRLTVIDTPGAGVPLIRTVVRNADWVLIPCRPSPLDLTAIGRTVTMVEAERRPLSFVLNGVTPRTRIANQAFRVLAARGFVAPVHLHQRTDYAASMTNGRTAQELDPAGKSAAEIALLWEHVQACLRKQARQPEAVQ